MRSYFRSLRFRLGLATPASITSPLTRIVGDLEAFVDHSNDEAAVLTLQQEAIRARKEVLWASIAEANAYRARIKQLVSF